MDWGSVYGTLIRNTGWTFQECGEQPAADVFEFLSHLAEVPPDYVILAARYLGPAQPKVSKVNRVDPGAMKAMQSVMGAPLPLPDDIRELVRWAESFGKHQVH